MEPNPNVNNPNPAVPAMISAAFPAPPPFYTSFTPGNLALLAAHETSTTNTTTSTAADSSHNDDAQAAAATSDLPEEVRWRLIPPREPRDGKYRSFGAFHDISLPAPAAPSQNSDESESVQQQAAQSQPPTQQRLLVITHNILLTFLALTHALASAPSTYAPIWDQLHALFQEAHAVVNDYRPHQARETLIAMMEAQVAKGREEGKGAREMGARVKAVLEKLGGGVEVAVEDNRDMGSMMNGRREHGVRGREREEDEETKRVWEVVGREVGFV